jgi:hypothetical protein
MRHGLTRTAHAGKRHAARERESRVAAAVSYRRQRWLWGR